MFNGYGDSGQRKVWTSLVSAYSSLSVTSYSHMHFTFYALTVHAVTVTDNQLIAFEVLIYVLCM